MNSETVLITGSGGLIGFALASNLARQGRRVVGYDLVRPLDGEGFDTQEGNLNDIHRLHALFRSNSVGSIVHCGAVSGPMVSLDNPYAICVTNIVGTANILELARIYGVRRVVYCSSTSAYGDTPPELTREDAPLNPKDVYGATKASGEHLMRAYALQHGIDTVSLRISWVFGPRRKTACLIRTMIEDALDNRPTRLDWGLGFYRQCTYVEDVVSALQAALDSPATLQPAYNVSGGTYLTIDQIGDVVRGVLPSAEIYLAPGSDPNDKLQGPFDISAARRDLGFCPRFSLKQGIEAYCEWIRGQRAV